MKWPHPYPVLSAQLTEVSIRSRPPQNASRSTHTAPIHRSCFPATVAAKYRISSMA